MLCPDLERQYDARAAFPDYVRFFDHWRATSESARRQLRALTDLAYGSRPLEKLDLFRADPSSAPLHVFIHGGYWRALDKSDFSFLAEPLVRKGVSVAILNYDLCPAVAIETIVEQVRHALLWLAYHAEKFGIDSSHIHLSGWSAGAHLVAMMFAAEWPDFEPLRIRSGLAISGLFDLDPLLRTSVNEDLRLDSVSARKYSPIFLRPRVTGPFAILVGSNETDEFRRQSSDFANAWRCFMPDLIYREAPDVHHFSVVSRMADPASDVFSIMTQLMEL